MQDAAQETPAAYECIAGAHHWTSIKPCPASYGSSSVVPIQGFTTDGTQVTGTGLINQQTPVQQHGLDQATLCDRLNAGANVGGRSDTERSYERNKAKQQNGCG